MSDPGGAFVLDGGDLGFSVLVYEITGLLLVASRSAQAAVWRRTRRTHLLLFLWFLFVVLCIWKMMFGMQDLAIGVQFAVMLFSAVGSTVYV